MFNRTLVFLIIVTFVISACSGEILSPQITQLETPTLTIMTHDSFSASEEVILSFEQVNNIKVQFLKAGDTGTALNKAILTKDSPLADVFFGVDNTFLSRALNEDIYEPYPSKILEAIPDWLKLDPQNRAIPVDYGDVCPNYDVKYFEQKNLAPPANLSDFSKPEYKSMLVVENPATSSPGLAFLLATIANFGSDAYLDIWKAYLDNGLLVVNDWETAYYTEFSVHGGSRPIVISYASSPPAEVIFAETPIDQPPTAVITAERSCFRQIEFVGILKGTQNRSFAEKWIDFMLSQSFQEDLPLQMFVFPVNPNASLPTEFQDFVPPIGETSYLDPDEIDQNREKWINEWTETILR